MKHLHQLPIEAKFSFLWKGGWGRLSRWGPSAPPTFTRSSIWELALGSSSDNVLPPQASIPTCFLPGATGRSCRQSGISGHTGVAHTSHSAAWLGSAAGQTEVWAPAPPPAGSMALEYPTACSESPFSETWTQRQPRPHGGIGRMGTVAPISDNANHNSTQRAGGWGLVHKMSLGTVPGIGCTVTSGWGLALL